MTRALLGTLVVCLMLMASTGAVSAMTPVGFAINNTCTLTFTEFGSAPADTASFDTFVANWIAVSGDTWLTASAGDTVWLPFSTTNLSGLPDTVTLAAVSRLGWNTQLYDSRTVGSSPLPAVQQLVAGQTLQFRVAVWKPGGAGGVTDTVSVGAVSTATATAFDSASATIQRLGQLHHFTVDAPAAIYAGVAFGITVTACDSDSNPIVAYDSTATVALRDPLFADTGTVTPDSLTQAVWAGGAWTGNLTISNCIDTLYLVIRDGSVAETKTLRVVSYRIALDKSVYQGLTDLMRISVWDGGQDTPPGVTNSVRVLVTSDADATGITVALTETGDSTGIFTGSVRFTEGMSQANAIRVSSNGNITVSYDPDGAGALAAVNAQASWIALVIADLERVRSWPNPFRPDQDREIVIHQLPSDPGMVIEIYNTAAQRIRTLRVGEEISVTPQENLARWDGRSEGGGAVASGTYVYVVRSAAGTVVRKLTLIR